MGKALTRRGPWGETEERRLVEMFEAGADDAAIAASVGRTYKAVQNRRMHIGLKRQACNGVMKRNGAAAAPIRPKMNRFDHRPVKPPVALSTFRARTCQWIGDSGEPGQACPDTPAPGRSYCAAHCRRVFVTPNGYRFPVSHFSTPPDERRHDPPV